VGAERERERERERENFACFCFLHPRTVMWRGLLDAWKKERNRDMAEVVLSCSL
jgi:hypothetical protein